ncbi:hypothetical protein C9426_34205 [Serratia sp. S1B]|nr:hypothetical protein C9426_34205 [Serratia sp. S1B]
MISGKISLEDFLAAQRLHRWRSTRWILLVIMLAVAFGLLLITIGHAQVGIYFVVAPIGGLIGGLAVSLLLLPYKARRIYRQYSALQSSFTYTWDTELLHCMAEHGTSQQPWSAYIKLLENKSLFLLYPCDNMFLMFPKKWFNTPEQIAEFRQLALQGINKHLP